MAIYVCTLGRVAMSCSDAWIPTFVMRFGTMGTTSPGLGREEQGGPIMSQPTRPKGTGQKAHNRGGLEDNNRIKSCK
jgi:hypothetical protein